MKRLTFILIALLFAAGFAMASGQDDGTMELTWVTTGSSAYPEWEDSKGYPGVSEVLIDELEGLGKKISSHFRT